MPRDLFGDVTRPFAGVGARSRYTVPLSLAAHTIVVGAVVVVPLVASDALPALLNAAPDMLPVDCQLLEESLRKSWSERLAHPENGGMDWRSRSVPLSRARDWHAAGAVVCGRGAPVP